MSQLSAVAKNLQVIFKKHDVTVPLTDEMLEQFAKFYKFSQAEKLIIISIEQEIVY